LHVTANPLCWQKPNLFNSRLNLRTYGGSRANMYESFFEFSARPFASAPLAKRFFPATAIEAARQTLARCIERSEGVGLLIGPAGTGKTLLCHVLAEQFGNSFDVALLAGGQLCTRRALLQAILFELGLPYRGMEESDLRLSLVDRLSPRSISASHSTAFDTFSTSAVAEASPNATAGLLLIVDEAHILPIRLLEELRLITNVVHSGQPKVRLVLSGGPQLEERFASPKLEAFNQRVAARCYLEALDRQQTIDYVRHQIQAVGGDPNSIFTADALEAIHSASDGVARLVNQLCDHALLLAYAGGARQLLAAGIEEAWADLQQLPTPRNAQQGAPANQPAGSVIEFGSLDDELENGLADDHPPAVPFRTADPISLDVSPAQRLRQITAQLAELDDDFHPAGSIGPEIELTVSAAVNPFAEPFEEEEVVIDRYTTPNTDALANRPLVRGAESRALGAILSAAALPSDAAQRPASVSIHQPAMPDVDSTTHVAVMLPSTSWPGGVPTYRHLDLAQSPAPPASSVNIPNAQSPITPWDIVQPPAQDFAMPFIVDVASPQTELSDPASQSQFESQELLIQKLASTVWPKAASEPESEPAGQIIKTPATAAQTTTAAADSEIDADLIVVEESPERAVPVAKQPVVRVRRKEYRQLFAQLRRG
jgi:type II secretory pathway predicted ATPase ExeA